MFSGLLAQIAEEVAVEITQRSSIWHRLLTGLRAMVLTIGGWCRDMTEIVLQPDGRLVLAAILGTWGLWLLMPSHRKSYTRMTGVILGGLAAAFLLSLVPPVTFGATSATFTLLAALTVAAAVGTVTSKSPVYSAVWFAVTLLGVGGLMLVNGAQFLGVATVAVYAGAIVVTILFVLMLAQPEGHSRYDRISWGRTAKWLGCAAGTTSACLLVWALLATPADGIPTEVNPTLTDHHVANLGGHLFSRYLIEIQIAGLLLFAALVGCVAIAGAKRRTGMVRQAEPAPISDDQRACGDIRHE
jgi:NADH-quinone oxidoreductase subunit J